MIMGVVYEMIHLSLNTEKQGLVSVDTNRVLLGRMDEVCCSRLSFNIEFFDGQTDGQINGRNE